MGIRHCKFVVLAYALGNKFSKMKRAESTCKRSDLKLQVYRIEGKGWLEGNQELVTRAVVGDLGF